MPIGLQSSAKISPTRQQDSELTPTRCLTFTLYMNRTAIWLLFLIVALSLEIQLVTQKHQATQMSMQGHSAGGRQNPGYAI